MANPIPKPNNNERTRGGRKEVFSIEPDFMDE
jgi:hypothetical protein